MIPSNDNPLGYRFFEDGGFPNSWNGGLFRTDFRVWLRANWIAASPELGPAERVDALLSLCYERVPDGAKAESLIEGISWFNQCGEGDRISMLELPQRFHDDYGRLRRRKNSLDPKAFDYFWDYKEIWASFMGEYRMDLYKIAGLHWWGFCAMMAGLGSESAVAKLMRVRSYPKRGATSEEVMMAKLAAIPIDRRQEEGL